MGNFSVSGAVTAQEISADGTTSTQIDSDGNGNFNIDQGDRAGNNLFHSFGDFSVPTNGSAIFNNAIDVSNIFSRVTGGNISNIDGLIQANGSANLFLINPAGIMFGNNARLDIGGSFFGTTADSVLFEDGVLSATDLDNPPFLTVNAPIGLNFRDNPAPITNSSNASADFTDQNPDVTFDDNLFGLRVPDGKTFALAGGDITADGGGIVAVGGRIELGAVGESGTLGINFEGDNISFSFPDDLARANVSLINNAGFLVSGSGGGDITITANNIEILEGSGLFAGIFEGLGSADAQAGDINLQANESILIDGITEDNDFSGVSNEVEADSLGNAGTLTITATNLSVTNGAQVSTSTFGSGNGGNLSINTTESVLINGASNNPNAFTGIFNQVIPGAFGNAGNTEINTQDLSLVNNARIASSTFGIGNGGSIAINASELVALENSLISSSIDDSGVGNSGSIGITTKNLSLTDGATIDVSTFGSGNAQTINISATEQIFLADSLENPFTSISNNVGSGGIGNSGGIIIDANSLSINDGAQLQSEIDGTGNSGEIIINADLVEFLGRDIEDAPSGAFSSVEPNGEGNAGGISITANTLLISNRAQLLSNTEGVGNAGDVNLNIADETSLLSSSIISEVSAPTETIAGGFGLGGNINITTGTLNIKDGSSLLADTENEGNAGNINIDVKEQFVLEGEGNPFSADFGITPSQISTTVEQQAIGDGGSITISTPSLLVKDSAFISATTFGQGTAGIVDITAGSIELENGAGIVAETTSGSGGNIFLQIDDNLTLKENSLISAQAFGDADGGNLTINTNFIIAFPNETLGDGSDIVASAVDGDGGNISITAESLLGIEEGEAIEGNGTNDIDASSDFGLDGTISIFTPDINPIQGATELPSNVVTPDQAVAQACNNNNNVRTASSFVIKGKGGVPPVPDAPMNSEMITVDGATAANSSQGSAISTGIGDITLARGVIKTADGSIILTATPIAGNSSRVPSGSPNCS
ncbi:MAG: filamentous hemagglutinin N-terminal domain-containing protein [Cyanobacteria bacterium P01_G01_bin.39]